MIRYSNQLVTLIFVYSWRKVWKKNTILKINRQHDGPVMELYCPLLVEEEKFQNGENC